MVFMAGYFMGWFQKLGIVALSLVVLAGCEIKDSSEDDFKFTGSGSLMLDGAQYNVTYAQGNTNDFGEMQFNFNIKNEDKPAIQLTFTGLNKDQFEQVRVANQGNFYCGDTYFDVYYVRHGEVVRLCNSNDTSSDFKVYVNKSSDGLYQVQSTGYTGGSDDHGNMHTVQDIDVTGIGFNPKG